jgi:hypothetical protein
MEPSIHHSIRSTMVSNAQALVHATRSPTVLDMLGRI